MSTEASPAPWSEVLNAARELRRREGVLSVLETQLNTAERDEAEARRERLLGAKISEPELAKLTKRTEEMKRDHSAAEDNIERARNDLDAACAAYREHLAGGVDAEAARIRAARNAAAAEAVFHLVAAAVAVSRMGVKVSEPLFAKPQAGARSSRSRFNDWVHRFADDLLHFSTLERFKDLEQEAIVAAVARALDGQPEWHELYGAARGARVAVSQKESALSHVEADGLAGHVLALMPTADAPDVPEPDLAPAKREAPQPVQAAPVESAPVEEPAPAD